MGQSPLAFVAQAFSGIFSPGRIDQQKALWSSPRHGKYYASAYGTPAFGTTAAQAGSSFRCSNPATAPVQLSAGLATTYVGLCLSNPATSTVNLVVRRVAGVLITAPATFIALGLIDGWAAGGITAHTTPLNTVISPDYIGAAPSGGSIVQPASAANVDSACTLVGTPNWDRWLIGNITSGSPISFNFDLDDDEIIPPGGYLAIGANIAGPGAGFLGTFGWEELQR
jgi:hypothetical protein